MYTVAASGLTEVSPGAPAAARVTAGARAARGVLFGIVGFAYPAVLLILATPLILHGLGEAAYGVWALVGNVVGYFAVVNALQTASTKYLAEFAARGDHGQVRALLGTTLAFHLLVGALGAAAIFAVAHPLASRVLAIPTGLQAVSETAFRVAAVGFFVSTLASWSASILSGLQRYDWLAGTTAAGTTMATLGSIVAVRGGHGVVGVAAATVAGTAVSLAASVWAADRLLRPALRQLGFDRTLLRSVLAYGMFSTVQIVCGTLVTQLDRTLLGTWAGVAAVTTYSVPLAVAMRVHQLTARALEVVFPMASALDAERRAEPLRRLFLRGQTANVVLVTMLAVPLLVLAHEILQLWIGAAFAERATLVFQLLVVAYAVLATNVVAAAVLAGCGRPASITAFVAALGAANVAGYVLLIPRFGAVGAAAASAAASVLCVPPFVWYAARRVVLVPSRAFLTDALARPVGAGVPAAVALLLVRPLVSDLPTLLLAVVASCAGYLGLTFLLGVWAPDERAMLRGWWARIHPVSNERR